MEARVQLFAESTDEVQNRRKKGNASHECACAAFCRKHEVQTCRKKRAMPRMNARAQLFAESTNEVQSRYKNGQRLAWIAAIALYPLLYKTPIIFHLFLRGKVRQIPAPPL